MRRQLRPPPKRHPHQPKPQPPTAVPVVQPPEAKFKACEVTDTGGIDDKSFNATAWKGVEDAQKQLGIEGKYLELQQQTDYEKNINAFIDEKCDIILTVGFLLGDATKAAAEKNPDVKFSIVDFAYDPTIPNVLGQVFSTDQAGFLAGYVAASVSKTGKIGTFGGIQIPTVTVFMDGYALGAKAYNEKHGTKVEVLGWDPAAQTGLFTGNFESTDDGRTMGETLMDEGADIIMPVAGPVGLGTAAAAKERGNTYIIGVDADWYLTSPDYADIILTSVLKNMDITTVAAIKSVQDGTFKGGVTVGTLENGGVGLAPFHDLESVVSKDVVAELDAVKADIVAGTLCTDTTALPPPEPTKPAPVVDLTKLIADAQAEGMLTTIALPHDWCNYGEVIETFSTKYGIDGQRASARWQLWRRSRSGQGQQGQHRPAGPRRDRRGLQLWPADLIKEGIVQPYKVSTWDTIPDSAKDPDGYWYGDYYGAMGFEVNTDVVANPPKT